MKKEKAESRKGLKSLQPIASVGNGDASADHKAGLSPFALCLGFHFFLCLSFAGAAPSANVDLSAKVDRSEITVGDRVRYEIEVTYPDSGRVELPSVLGNLGAFEVKDYQTRSGKAPDGRAVATHSFVISTFTVGAYTLPPQEVEYRDPHDSMALVLYTQPTAIQVKRTSPETVKDIADIADVVALPEPKPWGAIGLGALILAVAGYFLWRRFGPKSRAEEPAPPPPPPYEEAVQRLGTLNAAQLLRQNRAREFGFALSEILRNYVGRRYGVDALESTTAEFLEKCRALPFAGSQREWMKVCCDGLDQVKYASEGILETEADRLVREIRDFLDRTKPAPEPNPEEAGK